MPKFFIIRFILYTFTFMPLIFPTFYVFWDIYDDMNSCHSLIFIVIWYYMTSSAITYSPVDAHLYWKVSSRYKIPSSGNHLHFHATLGNSAVNSSCVDSLCTCRTVPLGITPRIGITEPQWCAYHTCLGNCQIALLRSYHTSFPPTESEFQLLHVHVNTWDF